MSAVKKHNSICPVLPLMIAVILPVGAFAQDQAKPAAPPADAVKLESTPAEPAPAAAVPAPATPAAAVPTPGTAPDATTTGEVVGTVPETVQTEPAFRYDATLPDPFQPYSEPILKCLGPGDKIPPGYVIPEGCGDEVKEPLEMFDLAKLKVLGIIWGIRDARAKIKDPENNYWTVRVGQKIGKNRGRIKAIREGEIEVEERYWDENLRAYQKITSTMTMSSGK